LLSTPPPPPAGYGHPAYAQSLAEFGTPLKLPSCGGWLLRRPIAGGFEDAMGPYPLFCCADWSGLPGDLDGLRRELVSVVLVADPFGPCDETALHRCFDRVMPFKTHFVLDLRRPGPFGKARHRSYARAARRQAVIEPCDPPLRMLADWTRLYDFLILRHRIGGIQAFSRASFQRQLAVPGLVAFRALADSGECIAAQLWMTAGDTAYYHLGAADETGYRRRAAYGLLGFAIDYFRGRVDKLDLGGAAGAADARDGLTQFKAGWANDGRPAYLCERILDPAAYGELAARSAAADSTYFPAYRGPSPGGFSL